MLALSWEGGKGKWAVDALTTQAFFNGTMWSMSRSLAAVQTPPSKGLVHDPEVAVHAELVWTLVPSRLSTNSLVKSVVVSSY